MFPHIYSTIGNTAPTSATTTTTTATGAHTQTPTQPHPYFQLGALQVAPGLQAAHAVQPAAQHLGSIQLYFVPPPSLAPAPVANPQPRGLPSFSQFMTMSGLAAPATAAPPPPLPQITIPSFSDLLARTGLPAPDFNGLPSLPADNRAAGVPVEAPDTDTAGERAAKRRRLEYAAAPFEAPLYGPNNPQPAEQTQHGQLGETVNRAGKPTQKKLRAQDKLQSVKACSHGLLTDIAAGRPVDAQRIASFPRSKEFRIGGLSDLREFIDVNEILIVHVASTADRKTAIRHMEDFVMRLANYGKNVRRNQKKGWALETGNFRQQMPKLLTDENRSAAFVDLLSAFLTEQTRSVSSFSKKAVFAELRASKKAHQKLTQHELLHRYFARVDAGAAATATTTTAIQVAPNPANRLAAPTTPTSAHPAHAAPVGQRLEVRQWTVPLLAPSPPPPPAEVPPTGSLPSMMQQEQLRSLFTAAPWGQPAQQPGRPPSLAATAPNMQTHPFEQQLASRVPTISLLIPPPPPPGNDSDSETELEQRQNQ
jgi:hypothetical protein